MYFEANKAVGAFPPERFFAREIALFPVIPDFFLAENKGFFFTGTDDLKEFPVSVLAVSAFDFLTLRPIVLFASDACCVVLDEFSL